MVAPWCVEEEERSWYQHYYSDNCAGEQIPEIRRRTNGGDWEPWEFNGEGAAPLGEEAGDPGGRFPQCVGVSSEMLERRKTQARVAWQSPVITEPRESANTPLTNDVLCRSERQFRQMMQVMTLLEGWVDSTWTPWVGTYDYAQCVHVQERVRWLSAGAAANPTADQSEEPCEFEVQTRLSVNGDPFGPWSGTFTEESCVQTPFTVGLLWI